MIGGTGEKDSALRKVNDNHAIIPQAQKSSQRALCGLDPYWSLLRDTTAGCLRARAEYPDQPLPISAECVASSPRIFPKISAKNNSLSESASDENFRLDFFCWRFC